MPIESIAKDALFGYDRTQTFRIFYHTFFIQFTSVSCLSAITLHFWCIYLNGFSINDFDCNITILSMACEIDAKVMVFCFFDMGRNHNLNKK